MHRILFPSRHTKCAHLTSISLPCILSRIRSCSSRLISVISDRHGRASAIIVLRKRDRERGTESIKAVGTTAFLPLPPAKGKQSLHIAFLHIFHSDWRWGDCPFVPPLDARFFRLEQAAWRATAVRLRRRGYAYPGGIAENGLIIMAGVVTPACFREVAYALGTQPLSIYTRHATLLERSSPFPTHPLPERASSNKRNKRPRDFLSFSHSLRVLRVTESINLSLSLCLSFSPRLGT